MENRSGASIPTRSSRGLAFRAVSQSLAPSGFIQSYFVAVSPKNNMLDRYSALFIQLQINQFRLVKKHKSKKSSDTPHIICHSNNAFLIVSSSISQE